MNRAIWLVVAVVVVWGWLGGTVVADPVAGDGASYGVYGENTTDNSQGYLAATNYGVYGRTPSTSGCGIYGEASATSGSTYGVAARSRSTSGIALYGYASATTGITRGIYGVTISTSGVGIQGKATAGTGTTYGIYGQSASTSGRGIYGEATATTGSTHGVAARTHSTDGTGIYAYASAATGITRGIHGICNSTSGVAIQGESTATSGTTYGIYAENHSTSGMALFAKNYSATGTTYGVFGVVNSDDGYAGYFTGGQGVYASGLNTGTFKMVANAMANYVLTSDGDGVGTWQSVTASAWGLTGNAGTTPGTNFLGTTDNQALELHVNSARALRIEPHAASPNLIGGYSGNNVTAGADGATIGGGGEVGAVNKVTDDFGTVSGGRNNQAGDDAGTIDDAMYATVGGGYRNVASDGYATVGGGYDNTASGFGATVGGGYHNMATALTATIGGGRNNTASDSCATVGGGYCNTASGSEATVPGGTYNTAAGDYSFAAGRLPAKANHQGAFVWADSTNADFNSVAADRFAVRATGGVKLYVSTSWDGLRIQPHATSPNLIGGHANNTVPTGAYACTIAGGGIAAEPNRATDPYCTVGGGIGNVAGDDDGDFTIDDADSATVAGGWGNTASNVCATVSGGEENTASGDSATIAGGQDNTASGECSTIGGGEDNTASQLYATVGGGSTNTAGGTYATVGGGGTNTASGAASCVPGGQLNVAAGDYSFAAGRRAKANHDGAFVWGDSTNADIASDVANQFVARASGGFWFYTNIGATTGAYLEPGSGTWTQQSDVNQKRDFSPVDPKAVLEKLVNVPIKTWRYKDEWLSVQHMGPMAQDLHAAFGLGSTDKGICTVDGDGISMAAIQGLYQMVQEKDAKIAEQEKRIKDLEDRLARIESALDALADDPNSPGE